MRSLQSGIKKCITGRHLPCWLGRCLTTEASHSSENLTNSFVTGPLTMLSEEEEMMRETGTYCLLHVVYTLGVKAKFDQWGHLY